MTNQGGFQFPKLFVQLDNEGCLDTDYFIGMDHFTSQKYLWFNDMEWLTVDDIENY